jgi:hypothetical protein
MDELGNVGHHDNILFGVFFGNQRMIFEKKYEGNVLSAMNSFSLLRIPSCMLHDQWSMARNLLKHRS